MATDAVNFRATAVYVTDGTDQTYDLGAAYPVTRSGLTFGWNTGITGKARNRSTSVDVRLAGMNQAESQVSVNWRLDLPATGDYTIYCAGGDAGSAQKEDLEFGDDTTYTTVTDNQAITSAQFVDAGGTVRTSAADWVNNNASINKTFSTTIFRIRLGNLSATLNSSVLAHVRVVAVGGGGGGAGEEYMMIFN